MLTLECYTEYLGTKFNKYHKARKTKLCKFLNNNLKHFDLTYAEGKIIDTKLFDPAHDASCGISFYEESDCHLYFDRYGEKMAIIEIPDNARIYVEKNGFRSDKIIIKKIIDFCDVDDEFWINIIPKNPSALQYINNQTKEICTSAVKQNSFVLQFVKEEFLTDDILILAVKQNSKALSYVNLPFRGTVCNDI